VSGFIPEIFVSCSQFCFSEKHYIGITIFFGMQLVSLIKDTVNTQLSVHYAFADRQEWKQLLDSENNEAVVTVT
jgi:hypothetical protein